MTCSSHFECDNCRFEAEKLQIKLEEIADALEGFGSDVPELRKKCFKTRLWALYKEYAEPEFGLFVARRLRELAEKVLNDE